VLSHDPSAVARAEEGQEGARETKTVSKPLLMQVYYLTKEECEPL